MSRPRRIFSASGCAWLAATLCCTALAFPAAASAAFAPLSTYGTTGTSGGAAGELDNPAGVVVDEAGNLFVADVSNHRIDQFSPGGAFVRAWGFGVDTGATAFEVCTTASGCQQGIGGGGQAGQLSSPFGIALAGGNLFITEEGNDRVSVFTTSGSFVRAFGFGVDTNAAALETCTAASGCQAGNQSAAAGGFAFPEGMTLDGANLFITGGNNNRIDQFTTGGAFVRAFGYGVDTGAATFEVCTAASTCQGGISGPAAGQLNGSSGIAADGAGNLFVASSSSRRVDQFTTGGAFVRAFGYGVDTGAAAFEVCTTASTCEAGVAGPGAGQLDDPEAVAIGGGGNLYVAEESNNRASQFTTGGAFVRAWGFGVDTGAPAFEICTAASGCQIGIDGTGTGQLSEPFGIGTDCRGAVYVVDDVNSNIQRFGEQGTAAPPCLSSSAAAGTTSPANSFSFGKLKLNKHRGTATLTVAVPGPGTLNLGGKGIKPQRPAAGAMASKAVGAAGKVKLTVKAKGKKRKKLNATGKIKVTAKVTYTPSGGSSNTRSRTIRLKKDLD